MYDDVGDFVEGEMSIPNKQNNIGSPDFNTLDEPIRDTIVNMLLLLNNLLKTTIFSLGM